MKEAGKGSLLLPLGIGAGVLLLLTSMKKKQTEPVKATEDATAMPLVTADEAAAPQIDPAPAPQYTQAMPKSAPTPEDADGEEGGAQEDPKDGQQNPGSEAEEPETDDDSEDGSYSAASSKSSSHSNGGSNTPYQPSSSINTNRPSQPLPAFQPASAATRQAINPKRIRFQSDQAKKFAARQKVRNPDPLFIGNGKPRMGVQQSVAYRPGATAAVQQPIIIASQSPQPAPAPVALKQTTIFPLRFGTTSPYVKEVQRRLGISATGYFGTQTKAAIQKRFGAADISEALYKQIITGKAVVKAPVKRPVPHAVKRIKKPLPKKAKVIR